MKSSQKAFLLLILLSFALTGCQSYRIYAEYNHEAEFKPGQTFAICQDDLEPRLDHKTPYDNEGNRKMIAKAIAGEMESRGYNRDDAQGVLEAGFDIVIETRQVVVQHCDNRSDLNYWPACTLEKYEFTEGTLIVYVMDIRRDEVLWQGFATGVLNSHPKRSDRVIKKAIRKIFEKYPLQMK